MLPDTSRHFDVAIAGAGPAGASLALRLARAGLRVVVLDGGRFPRDKLCGEFLSPEGAQALERLGLTATGAVPIRHARLTTPRGNVLDTELAGPEGRPGLGLSRATLDHQLVQNA